MTTSTVAPEISAFAQGVREALSDLPADEVDDLTDGLEADLAESLAEDLRRTLPDPVAYAAELRLAAGLPAPTVAIKRGVMSGLRDGWRETSDAIGVTVRRNPVLVSLLEFAEVLRPAWWIFRSWIATWLIAAFFGMERGYWFDGISWMLFAALAVVSVQWGRGRWTFRGVSSLVVIGNVIAVVALLPLLNAAQSWGGGDTYYYGDGTEQDLIGVYLNGEPVTNIFGYDASGRPLDGVQLFDQDGNPLATAVAGADGCLEEDCNTSGLWAPSTLQNGTVAWNVFPMKMVKAEDVDGLGLKAVQGAEPENRPAPFATVPALVAPKKVAKSD